MTGPTRDRVFAAIFGFAGPRNIDVAEEMTDAVMALLAETQPQVLWTWPTEKRSGSFGRSGVETPPLSVPPGTKVAVVVADTGDTTPGAPDG